MFTFRSVPSLLVGAAFLAFGMIVGALNAATTPTAPIAEHPVRG
jgi:hypothetical protein